MLTFLIGTQAVLVSATSSYVIHNLIKQRYTKLKLIRKDKNGFKHYRNF